MATVSYRLEDLKKAIVGIGYVGENDHMHVLIDCKEAFDEYPAAVPTMVIVPPVGDSYPKAVTRNGDVVEWLVKNSDVTVEGDGEFQLTFTEDEVIKKSVNGRFRVKRSISGSGEAPSGVQDWVADANEKLAAVEEATQEAEAAAEHQPKINASGYWEIWDAEQGAYVATTVKAQGDKGDPGDPGSPGDPTELIDDTAGEGVTDKTLSADKLAEKFGDVLTDIDGVSNELKDVSYFEQPCGIVQVTWDVNGDGKYIGAGGTIGNTSSFHYSDLISVEQNQKYTYMFSYIDIYTDFTCRIHGYDENGIWIKQIEYKQNIFVGGSIQFVVDDERIKDIRISIRKEAVENILVKGEPTEISIQWDENGDGKYIGENGTIDDSSSFHYSQLIEVEENTAYYYVFSRTATSVINIRIHGYDANGQWVEQVAYSKTNSNEGNAYAPFTVGSGIKYIRISTSKNVTGESLSAYVESFVSVKSVVESLTTKTIDLKLKVSSMGRIDDSIDSIVESGSEFEMCAVRKKYMGNNKPPVTIGWLYQRSPVSSSGCDLWYSANQMDKPKLIGTMQNISPNDEYRTFDISPKYGDIITCKRDARNAPVVYDASEESTVVISGLDTNPIGWQRNCGGEFALNESNNEYFMFGEYTGHASTSSGYGYVNIWKVTYPYTDPANWNIVLSIQRESSYNASETGKVWHVHTVMRDPYTNIWYVTTGDCDKATIWYYSTDEGETWTQMITGQDLESQRARLLNFVFTEDYIWWANDYGTNHSLNRASRNGNGLLDVSSIVRIAELNKMQSTYATAYLDYPKGLLMLDRVDTSFGSLTDKLTVQFYSFDDGKVHDLYTFKRMSNSPDLFFGFKCKCYTLRQSPYDARIGVGFDVAAPNWVEMNGNADNSMWTLFFEVS